MLSAPRQAVVFSADYLPEHVITAFGLWRPGGLSDARVTREGPTTADVYIDISPFYGMAPATASGYRSGGRRYA